MTATTYTPWQRATTAAAAAALATLALTGCTGNHKETAKPPVRVEASIPAGMERYAVTQNVLTIHLPPASPARSAATQQKVVAAAQNNTRVPPVISTASAPADPASASKGKPGKQSATITVELVGDADVTKVKAAIGKAAPKAKIDTADRKALAFQLRVPTAGADGVVAADKARTTLGPILFGGYNVQGGPNGVTVTYIGGGVTPAGVDVVRDALAKALAVDVKKVAVEPIR